MPSIIKPYLADRYQVPSWNGEVSWPKGSVIGPFLFLFGPFLFLLSINDLYYYLNGNLVLIADDATLYSSSCELSTAMKM